MSQHQAVRRVILTAAFTAITATGAWYGAGLKTQQEYTQARKVVYELPVEERIAGLEMKRARLVAQKTNLEHKLADVEARRAAAADAQPTK